MAVARIMFVDDEVASNAAQFMRGWLREGLISMSENHSIRLGLIADRRQPKQRFIQIEVNPNFEIAHLYALHQQGAFEEFQLK